MMLRFAFIFLMHFQAVLCYLNFKFLGSRDGLFQKARNGTNAFQEWPFIASPNVMALQSTFGSLTIYPDMPTVIPGFTPHTVASSQHLGGFLVSAHVVSDAILPGQPLRVLFHVNHTDIKDQKLRNSSRPFSQQPNTFCLYAHATRTNQTLTSYCQLNPQVNGICLAQLTLPARWWAGPGSSSTPSGHDPYHIDVLYSMEEASCPHNKKFHRSPKLRFFLDSIELVPDQSSYQELKEDQHILIYAPQSVFSPGSMFKIPVKLQADSNLASFDIRVKTKSGIWISSLEVSNSSVDIWQFKLETNSKPSSWMINARTHVNYSKYSRVQELFELVFEINETFSTTADWMKLMFTLEYDTYHGGVKYGKIENKATVRIQINPDKTFAIVPVVKSTEMINAVLLSGVPSVHPLQIFSVSHSGSVQDVTSLSTCDSSDEAVAMVSESCHFIELMEKSTKGSPGMDVICKYGRHTKILKLKVWVPELPLDIELSDPKLSQISGWKFVASNTFIHGNVTSENTSSSPQSSYLLSDATNCQPKYQSSLIDIYARLITSSIADDSSKLEEEFFAVNRINQPFKVTHLLRERIKVVDPLVGRLISGYGGLVSLEGLKPGRSELQVLSVGGRVLGLKPFKVTNEKVSIVKLETDIVTDLNVIIEGYDATSGQVDPLVAKVSFSNHFDSRKKVGVLDAHLLYDDLTKFPIHNIDSETYSLEMNVGSEEGDKDGGDANDDEDDAIIIVGGNDVGNVGSERWHHQTHSGSKYLVEPILEHYHPESMTSTTMPSTNTEGVPYILPKLVLAPITSNLANIKFFSRSFVFLKFMMSASSSKCAFVTSKPNGGQSRHALAVGKAQFSIDGSVFEELKISRDNHSSSFFTFATHESNNKKKFFSDVSSKQHPQVVVSKQGEPRQKDHYHFIRNITALETAMFVAVVVFCIVVAVLLVHWVLNAARKRRPMKVKDSGSGGVCGVENDWVWIGHKTLEKNAVQTTCLATLMPEEDFNSSVGGAVSNGGLTHGESPPPLPPREWKGNGIGACSGTAGPSRQCLVKKWQQLQHFEKKKKHPSSTAVPSTAGNFRIPIPPRPSRAPRLSSMPSASLSTKIGDAYLINDPSKLNQPLCTEVIQAASSVISNSVNCTYIGGGAYPGDTLSNESGAASQFTNQQQADVWLKKSMTNDGSTCKRAQRIRKLEEAAAASGSDVDFNCASMDEDQFLKYLESLKESSA